MNRMKGREDDNGIWRQRGELHPLMAVAVTTWLGRFDR